MLCIPFVHLPLPSRVTDCILSYLRMDNEMNVLNPVAKAKPKPKAKARGKARNKPRLMDVRLRPKAKAKAKAESMTTEVELVS